MNPTWSGLCTVRARRGWDALTPVGQYEFDSMYTSPLHLSCNSRRTSSKLINATGNSECGILEREMLVPSLQRLDLEDLQLPAGYCILIGDTRDSPRRAAAADMHAVLHTVEAEVRLRSFVSA